MTTREIPVVRTAVRSWIGAVEAASLDWLAHRDLERASLVGGFEGSGMQLIEIAIDRYAPEN